MGGAGESEDGAVGVDCGARGERGHSKSGEK